MRLVLIAFESSYISYGNILYMINEILRFSFLSTIIKESRMRNNYFLLCFVQKPNPRNDYLSVFAVRYILSPMLNLYSICMQSLFPLQFFMK